MSNTITFDNELELTESVPVSRPFALYFEMHTDVDIVSQAIETMNTLFLSEFPGVGYIDIRPSYKEGERGVVEAFHLHADTAFWDAFLARRASVNPWVVQAMQAAAAA